MSQLHILVSPLSGTLLLPTLVYEVCPQPWWVHNHQSKVGLTEDSQQALPVGLASSVDCSQ